MTEARIRELVDDWASPIRARDLDRVMSFYAPELVSFDLDPPLRYAGADAKRRAWQAFFAAFTGAIGYEVRELQVTTAGDLALIHGVNHVQGTLVGGRVTNLWVRFTAGLRRTAGTWLVVHDHVSVPVDLAQDRAVLDLTP